MSQSTISDHMTRADSTRARHFPAKRPYPAVQPAHWSFMLGGSVAIPLMLSYADLRALPSSEMAVPITCAGHPASASHLRLVHWSGVPLTALLQEIDIQPGNGYAHLYTADGYTTCLDLAALDKAILAYRMDEAELKPEAGGPVRLILPDHYGYKLPKWIQRILLAASPLTGTWEQRGWPASGSIQPTATLLNPRHRARLTAPIELSGTAFAGSRPITGVEIRVDSGPWMPARIAENTPHTVARWSLQWTAPVPGEHHLQVRAADAAGFPPDHLNPTTQAIIVHVEE